MENTNIVTTEQQAPNTISASNAIFNVQALGQLTAFANLMADSQVTVPGTGPQLQCQPCGIPSPG
ncbi:hypothetical protein LJN10_003094 [Salmonella enterica]|nr:hypothetical protein [Salmonella enterica]